MRVSVVVGNPTPRSRTMLVAQAVAQRVARHTGAEIAQTIDLADYATDIFSSPHEKITTLAGSIAASDYAVIASPTYKAAYTGLLKAFLDRFQDNGLAGVTAVMVMTGGSAAHSMAIDTTLRPLLVELGASVPTAGFFFEIARLEELDSVVDEWARRAGPVLRRFAASATPAKA